MVLLKNWSFFHFLFFNNIGQENVFYDFLQRKNAFLGNNKKKSTKSRKIDIFPKGIHHGFAQKLAISPSFFLNNIGQENYFYDILERKNAFLGNKNNKFAKSKN